MAQQLRTGLRKAVDAAGRCSESNKCCVYCRATWWLSGEVFATHERRPCSALLKRRAPETTIRDLCCREQQLTVLLELAVLHVFADGSSMFVCLFWMRPELPARCYSTAKA